MTTLLRSTMLLGAALVACKTGPSETSHEAPPSASAVRPAASAPTDKQGSCVEVMSALAVRACDCVQKGNEGCCVFGEGAGGKAVVDCSRGDTQWPSKIAARLCKDAASKPDAVAACRAARAKAACGASASGDQGLKLPPECAALLD